MDTVYVVQMYDEGAWVVYCATTSPKVALRMVLRIDTVHRLIGEFKNGVRSKVLSISQLEELARVES